MPRLRMMLDWVTLIVSTVKRKEYLRTWHCPGVEDKGEKNAQHVRLDARRTHSERTVRE